MCDVIIIGAGGHAKVIADIITKCGDNVLGYLDDKDASELLNFKVIGKVCDVEKYKGNAKFVIGIGNNATRMKIAHLFDVTWYTAIHPSAVIASDVMIGDGTVVMANATINTSTKIGAHCIINTGAIVEHDNNLGDFIHISPNATLCGSVMIGEKTHVGAGATIINNINIQSESMIGAGAVVVCDIKKSGTYIGVPAVRQNK